MTVVAYSYIRFSTPEQMLGDSLRRQMARAERFALARGWLLNTSHQDHGFSAFHGANRKKGALGAFLATIEAGKILPGSYLLVEAIDRLVRTQPYDAFEICQSIINKGITIITLDDGSEYNRTTLNKNPGLLSELLGKIRQAYGESARKSDLLSETWKNKRTLAMNDNLPHGRNCPAWLKLSDDKKSYEIIPEKAAIVRRIYNETINGLGKDKIARRLNAENVPVFGSGNGWHASYIQKILQTRAVIGEYTPHEKSINTHGKRVSTDRIIKNYFPEVISVAEWQAAQSTKAQRRGTGGKKGETIANLVSGHAVCSGCGGGMVLVKKGKKGVDALFCQSARRNIGCTRKSGIWYDGLETELVTGLLSVISCYEMLPPAPVAHDSVAEDIARLADKIGQDTAKITALVSRFDVLSPALLDVVAGLEAGIKQAQAEHAALIKHRIETPIADDEELFLMMQGAKEAFKKGGLVERARVMSVLRRAYSTLICDVEAKTVSTSGMGGRVTVIIENTNSNKIKTFVFGDDAETEENNYGHRPDLKEQMASASRLIRRAGIWR